MKFKVLKIMAKLKAIKSSICKNKNVWKKICDIALSSPTDSQIAKVRALQEKFAKVYKA